MTDKYQALREAADRAVWVIEAVSPDTIKALLAERDALLEALQAVVDAAGPESGPEIGRAVAALAKAIGEGS